MRPDAFTATLVTSTRSSHSTCLERRSMVYRECSVTTKRSDEWSKKEMKRMASRVGEDAKVLTSAWVLASKRLMALMVATAYTELSYP